MKRYLKLNGLLLMRMIQLSEIFGTSLDYLILGKCHDVLDAHHLKENIQHLIEDLEHFQTKL